MKYSATFSPTLALTSQVRPEAVTPLTPEIKLQSETSPPKLGVKPPGNSSLNTKQFGLALIAAKAKSELEPAPAAGTGTTGHVLAAPDNASARSPTSLVAPPSLEKTPPLLVGFLKKNPPSTFLSA